MERAAAEEIREQLLELFDERHEAGPTDYVVHRATVEPDADEWAFVLVVSAAAGAAPVQRRVASLTGLHSGQPCTAEELAWELYGAVEAGTLTAGGDGADGRQ